MVVGFEAIKWRPLRALTVVDDDLASDLIHASPQANDFIATLFESDHYRRTGPNSFALNDISQTTILLTPFFLNGWHPEQFNAIVPGGWSIVASWSALDNCNPDRL
jgi:hypothetical protein